MSCVAKKEESAMAIVVCKGKILATNENIYGKIMISLPKGHVENSESPLDASIRECFEETNVIIKTSDLVHKLTPYSYEFLTSSNELIKKEITPYLFIVSDFGNPISKEERIISVEWMEINLFLSECSYETVKNAVREALNIIKYQIKESRILIEK